MFLPGVGGSGRGSGGVQNGGLKRVGVLSPCHSHFRMQQPNYNMHGTSLQQTKMLLVLQPVSSIV